MGNVSNRRKLRVAADRPEVTPPPESMPRRPPWNKGLTLTRNPSASTLRRQLRSMEAMGTVAHTTERGGKHNRPGYVWSLTRDGILLHEAADLMRAAGWDPNVLTPARQDRLIRLGYAARDEGARVVFLPDYQGAWKYWHARDGAAVMERA